MIQVLARMFYRAFVVSMLFLFWDNKAIYGLPIGIIVGLLTEFDYITKNKRETWYVIQYKNVHPNLGDVFDVMSKTEFDGKYPIGDSPKIIFQGDYDDCSKKYSHLQLFGKKDE